MDENSLMLNTQNNLQTYFSQCSLADYRELVECYKNDLIPDTDRIIKFAASRFQIKDIWLQIAAVVF